MMSFEGKDSSCCLHFGMTLLATRSSLQGNTRGVVDYDRYVDRWER